MNKALTLPLLFLASFVNGQLLSPEKFLGYQLGERFTRHHRVVEYFEHVAASQPNVKLEQYGETYEHRPLITAVVSSQQNMDRWDEIRENNLRRAKMLEGNIADDNIAIVWLSYNIHGNEASSIEASMQTIYELVTNDRAGNWMKNTVVIIDPCINPDGRDRYANFYNQYGSHDFNPDGNATEHREPWPGGRPNHYLFDLNRDWAWQTQQESVQRIKAYHEIMPHIHVDFHEQGHNNPYYFAPAAEPFHEVITPWQREFQQTIGKNHSKYFDKENWLYFTKERFDLLYPSYGDTYPTYNGAIGMTYEQAGGGFAGLGIITEYEDTLTLKDRVLHHFTTGMSTVEISSLNARRLTDEFKKYFSNNVNSPAGKYKTYVIKGSNGKDKIASVTQFLEKQKIRYGTGSSKARLRGFNYLKNGTSELSISSNDLIISTYQPKSRLVTALFEPVAKLSDTLTYDITAWSIPYAYGVEAYALSEKIAVTGTYKFSEPRSLTIKSKPYAYLAKYNSLEDVKWLSSILQKGIHVRVAHKRFTLNGSSFEKGTLVVTRRTNERLGERFDEIIHETAKKYDRDIMPVRTGFMDSGVDLGSGEIARIKKPKIAVLSGAQTSSLSFGEIWHFFERQLDYPITPIRTDYFKKIDLDDYNVLILPHGQYTIFSEDQLKRISKWVGNGGKLIAIGNALNGFKDRNGFLLKEFSDGEKKKDNGRDSDNGMRLLQSFESYERDNLSKAIFGAIFKVTLDQSNPLAYGYGPEYYSLKTTNSRYAYLEKGQNVGVLKKDSSPVSGFAGFKAVSKLENSLVFGIEQKGKGQIIYMVDNPLFRAFWENGKLLFSNAVFITGNR
ncbi:zinc carboxypeptidase [Fulvivirga sp. M361]|uniref:M14 family metallopeptidase n=1 Tax=Fulvivirga sp. M361 TaxID=2594266 RepID=UPI00117A5ACE|nr:M14 family metallopeptidase [Fulvivirga sp. M361]TRX58637.1 zinc carboxypeptidase [Fulvivirga sp. M361]